MNSIIITYDLCKPTQNYDSVIEKIKQYGTYAKLTESCWFIKTIDSCVSVRNNLLTCLDKNDRLFVAQLTGVAAWANTIASNEFISKNL